MRALTREIALILLLLMGCSLVVTVLRLLAQAAH